MVVQNGQVCMCIQATWLDVKIVSTRPVSEHYVWKRYWRIYLVGNTVVVVLFRAELGLVLDSQMIMHSYNCIRIDFSFRHVVKSGMHSNNASTRLGIVILYTYMDWHSSVVSHDTWYSHTRTTALATKTIFSWCSATEDWKRGDFHDGAWEIFDCV